MARNTLPRPGLHPLLAAEAANPTTEVTPPLQIPTLRLNTTKFWVVGQSPIIFNRMPLKAWHELLYPRGKRRTEADRAGILKHEPVMEFRGSVNISNDDRSPTALVMPAPAFKGAMCTAALDLEGLRKTQVGRRIWVEGDEVPVWGIPMLRMDVVRSADMAHTPDIRTRAICKNWCACLEITYVRPFLTNEDIAKILFAGGILSGIGDFRQEKGKGSYGRYEIVAPEDPRIQRLLATAGRAAQEAALDRAEPFNLESQEMLDWFNSERASRSSRQSIVAEMAQAAAELVDEKPGKKKRGRPRKQLELAE